MAVVTNKGAARHVCTSQIDVSELYGVSPSTITRWISWGMPGSDGCYPIRDLIKWREAWWENRTKEAAADPMFAGEDTDQLDKYRKARTETEVQNTRLKTLEADEREGLLVAIDRVQPLLSEAMNKISEAGRRLESTFGDEAGEIINSAIDQAAEVIQRIASVKSGDDSADE